VSALPLALELPILCPGQFPLRVEVRNVSLRTAESDRESVKEER
jgi:hypothetical protein